MGVVEYGSALASGDGPRPGEVWLVGAGPGDPGLLTLRAAEALRRADLVLHDALPGRAVLRLVRAGAKIVPVGKRKGAAPLSQAAINARLVAGARAGTEGGAAEGRRPLRVRPRRRGSRGAGRGRHSLARGARRLGRAGGARRRPASRSPTAGCPAP